ncbi:MAG: hypothetical protein IIA88_05510 [Bacteroidetes bacterium]|nr:hypothetical protein [Bacteroidota bacterium]
MNISDFTDSLLAALRNDFPNAIITIKEKRGIIVEARIKLTEKVFLDVYFNSLTDKKSFALIHDDERIFGYDNYKYWHLHPFADSTKHIPCEEPGIKKVIQEIKEIIRKL